MKSQITHEDINEAIIQLIRQRYNPEYLEGKEITVELTAGRKENGNSAIIDIKPKHLHFGSTREDMITAITESLEQAAIESEPQDVGDVTEVEPIIPDETPVLHTDF